MIQELEKIRNAATEQGHVAIYGAGVIGYDISLALKELYNISVEVFLVSQKDGNPREIEGIPVIEVLEWKYLINGCILIAAPEEYHMDMVAYLKMHGVERYICIDSELEYAIMSKYFQRGGRFRLLEDVVGKESENSEKTDVFVAMARWIGDRQLKRHYELPEWIVPIQVGAGETEQSMGILADNTGENISKKNHNYSELTASYWLWKNNSSSYKGICHYRRYLKISPEGLQKMTQGNVDAVLPLPFICYPDAEGQYGRYISKKDREILFSVLEEQEPEYGAAAKTILKGAYLYNYNMLIAKREVYDHYCEWMFPLLFEVERKMEERGKDRRDRYIGYMGEVLTSLYFMKNSNELNIVHGCKIWMV